MFEGIVITVAVFDKVLRNGAVCLGVFEQTASLAVSIFRGSWLDTRRTLHAGNWGISEARDR